MKRLMLLALLSGAAFSPLAVSACSPTSHEVVEVDQNGKTCKSTAEEVGTPPRYSGGIQALLAYINKNVRYPPKCVKEGISGKVVVGFTVTEKGRVRGVHVRQSSGNQELDAEAVRVVAAMPQKWHAARDKKGRKMAASFNLPVSFRIQ